MPAALYVTDINQAGPTSNVRLTATTALTTNRSINSLLVDGGASLTAPANAVLTVGSGNFTFRGSSTIGVGNVNVNGGIMYVPAGVTVSFPGTIYSGTVQKDGTTFDKIGVKALSVKYEMDPNADSPAKVISLGSTPCSRSPW